MNDKTIYVLLTLAFAAAAGFVYGGWRSALIAVLAMAAWICWRYS